MLGCTKHLKKKMCSGCEVQNRFYSHKISIFKKKIMHFDDLSTSGESDIIPAPSGENMSLNLGNYHAQTVDTPG